MAVKLIAGAAGVAAFTVSYCVLSKLDNAITNKIIQNKNKKAMAEAQRQQALMYQQQAMQMAAEQQAQQQQAMEMANHLYEQAANVMAQAQQAQQQQVQQPASVINWDNPSETELEFAASMGDPRALKIINDRMEAVRAAQVQQQAQQQTQQPVIEIIPPQAEDAGNTGLQLKPGQKVVLASDAKTIEGETLTRFKGIFRGYENDGKVAVVTVSYGGNIGSKNHKVPADVVTPA